MDAMSQLYPEYYILKVNGFNQVAQSPLEEWISLFWEGTTAIFIRMHEASDKLCAASRSAHK